MVKWRLLVFMAVIFGLANTFCGVKGDPMPPEKPPELGRGKPSYGRAISEILSFGSPSMKKKDSKEGQKKEEDEKK